MGRDPLTTIPKDHYRDFNSHARVGRDVDLKKDTFLQIISTHTPAWGAT